MKDELIHESIKNLLKQQRDTSDPAVQAELQKARQQALNHYEKQASNHKSTHHICSTHATRRQAYLALGVVLFASMLTTATWLSHSRDHKTAEVDMAILTGELPVSAYVE